jgi:RNA polymerase sigma-70 factor (ECF subfamily)
MQPRADPERGCPRDTGRVDGGDDDARRFRFESLAAQVTEPVRRFLARRTDPDTADDVLADTLLVLWRRLDDVPAGDEALAWTYAVAHNALANAERAARRQRRLAYRITVSHPPDEAAPGEPEPDDRVSRALERMRPDEAELLRLWAWEQLGPGEIATVLGLTPNAVSIRLHRARGRFKEILERSDGG